MVQSDFNKVYVWETKQDVFVKKNASDMANSKMHGEDHKDKYFDTSRKILSQEITICIVESLIYIF